MDGEKSTYQSSSGNSGNSSSRQYYLDKRQAPHPWGEQQNDAIKQKKARNNWHYLAIADGLNQYNIEDKYQEYGLETLDINAQDRYGNTSLHYAYAYEKTYSSTVKTLLAKGANPDIRNNRGLKPGEHKLSGLASLKQSVVTALPNMWVTSAATFISNLKGPTQPITCSSVIQEQFAAEVKKFKKEYGIKSLKDEVFSPLGRPLYENFITNPVILAWLTRPFGMVQFREDGAPLVDKYELEFYDGMARYSKQLVGQSFTIEARANESYGGMSHYYQDGLDHYLSVGLNRESAILAKEEKGVCFNNTTNDIYGVGDDALGGYKSRDMLNSALLSITNLTRANHYTIYWTSKNDTGSAHRITCVTKYDDKGTAEAVFMLNSEYDEDYNNAYLESRFRHNTYYDSKQVPYTWIDASHSIQTASDDGNCVIYSLNFCKAIKEFLTTPAYRTQMDAYCNAKQYKEAGTYLSNGIKALMPQYYEKDEKGEMVTVSPEALKQYHLKFRWELGNEAIRRLYDLAMV